LTPEQRQLVLAHTPPGSRIAAYVGGRLIATRVEGYAFSSFMALTNMPGESVWDHVCVVYQGAAGQLTASKYVLTFREALASWHLVDGEETIRAGGGVECTRERLEEMVADWPRYSSRPLRKPRIVHSIPAKCLDKAPSFSGDWSGSAPSGGPCVAGWLRGQWIAVPKQGDQG
jgi:hypothetical protein